MSTSSSSRDSGRFDELAREFAQRYRRGERPSLQEYVERLPDMADQIRETFPAIVDVEQVEADARVEAPLAARERAGPVPNPDATGRVCKPPRPRRSRRLRPPHLQPGRGPRCRKRLAGADTTEAIGIHGDTVTLARASRSSSPGHSDWHGGVSGRVIAGRYTLRDVPPPSAKAVWEPL